MQRPLTIKQRKIVHLVCAECMETKDIAKIIGLAPHTIKNYRKKIYDVLGVWSIPELCRYYWNHVEEFPE